MKRLLMTSVIAGLALAGCKKTPEPPPTETMATMASAIGAAGEATQTIAQNVAASPEHKMLAAALAAAGETDDLSGKGPFTVFAPTDAAFTQVPVAMRDAWMRPESKARLAGVLRYHVVPGRLSGAELAAQIREDGGRTVLKTISGEDLTASLSGDRILLTAAGGNKATVTTADLAASNGTIHVVDAVLLPGAGG